MYRKNNAGKHYIPAHRRRRLRRRKQQSFVIGLAAFLCSILSFVTLAYVFTRTEPVENTFEDADVACDVQETFDGSTKSDVTIKNTGEVQSYIRAAVVVTWMSEDETKVTALKPVDDRDYVVTYADETGTATHWEKGADGYWYYKIPVDVDDETENLIKSCSLKDGVTTPDGFYLSVEIVASAIQSTPTDVVVKQWNSGVSGVDGTTLKIHKVGG